VRAPLLRPMVWRFTEYSVLSTWYLVLNDVYAEHHSTLERAGAGATTFVMNDFTPFFSSLLIGSATALTAHAGRDLLARGFARIERDVADKLRALRMAPRSLRQLLVAWLVTIGCVFAVLGLVLESPLLALAICAILACLPWYLVRRLAERRRLAIEDQLADSMVSFSNGVRAGLSIPQALDILAEQSPRPVRDEFRQITSEFNLGKPLEQTLVESKERLRSENFSLFAAALLASRRSGGKLNETVERIARSVLELQRLERKVQSETAQARKSAVYMAIAPAVILVVYYFVDPVNTTALFTTFFGQMLLSAALVLNVTAYVWARVILSPDI
jgi:tight adherence protein B